VDLAALIVSIIALCIAVPVLVGSVRRYHRLTGKWW
jgi:DMSO/TMAO reductase YedYZ heme-binding membrane subunit